MPSSFKKPMSAVHVPTYTIHTYSLADCSSRHRKSSPRNTRPFLSPPLSPLSLYKTPKLNSHFPVYFLGFCSNSYQWPPLLLPKPLVSSAKTPSPIASNMAGVSAAATSLVSAIDAGKASLSFTLNNVLFVYLDVYMFG